MQYKQEDIRCPVDKKLLGRYSPQYGIKEVTFYCPKCKAEYIYTISPNVSEIKVNKVLKS